MAKDATTEVGLQQLDEDDILTTCALRFRGYDYQEAYPFDQERALEHFVRTGEWDLVPLEQLTAFFMLQRYLFKWGGEQLARDSQEWRAFRSLFLTTYAYEIPAEYRHPDYDEPWEREYRPHLVTCVKQVRRTHDATDYQST